jgi:ABC-type transport system involved in multi-copper enzyme maturation permease subunit
MNNMAVLMVIEVRKMTDTRSARILLAGMLAIGLCIAGLVIFVAGTRGVALEYAVIVGTLALPAALGAPIIGVLGMTGDWQHRDVMTFFALVSRRWKIFVAKIAGTLIVSLAIVLAVVALSLLLCAILVPTMGLVWILGDLGRAMTLVLWATVLGSVSGAAISSALMSVPLSMVFIVLQTLLFDTLIALIPGGSAPFLQAASLSNALTDGAPAGPALTSLALWILLPLGIGFWRNQYREVA